MRIMLCGGAGYIGAHTCVELMGRGHEVVVVDSLVNSSVRALERIGKITGSSVVFHQLDVRDKTGMAAIFAEAGFDAVMHFAALSLVGESMSDPGLYWRTNVNGSLNLIEAAVAATQSTV